MAFGEADIMAELIRRKRARESLVGYSRAITIPGSPLPGYEDEDPDTWVFQPVETGVALHHEVTMRAIEQCISTPYGRLMIFEPPGSAKSTYASVVAPTWAMGIKPGLQVLATSYADIPIERHSKRARQIVKSIEYTNIWEEPTTLVKGSMSAKDWELTNGSRFYCGGLMGSITSTRCDLGLIDDPVKNREDADSELIRRKTKQEYQDTFLSRLKPQASIILIQTRWHEDDLAGGILPEGYDGRSGWIDCRDGQQWYVLNIPAKAVRADDPLGREQGEYLWPEWFGTRHWQIFEPDPTKPDGPNQRTWSALFQQDPQPMSGGQFEEEWIHRFNREAMPKNLVLFGTGDWALTKKQIDTNPDYTVLGAWGMDRAGDLWLFDGWYGRDDLIETLSQWHRLRCLMGGINEWASEGGPIRRAAEPMLRKMMEETQQYSAFTWFPTGADKVANAASFRGRAQGRKVHVVNGPFGDYVVKQLAGFPFGRYDDAVDMCGLAGRYLDKRYNPKEPEQPRKKKSPRPGTYEYLSYEDDLDEKRKRDYMS